MVRILAILAALILVAAPVFAQTGSTTSSDKPASSTDMKDADKAKDTDAKKKDAAGSASPTTSGSGSSATDSSKSGSTATPMPSAAPATGSEKK